MTGPIEVAYVEVRARLDEKSFAKAAAAIDSTLGGVEKRTQKQFDTVARSVDRATEKVSKSLDSLGSKTVKPTVEVDTAQAEAAIERVTDRVAEITEELDKVRRKRTTIGISSDQIILANRRISDLESELDRLTVAIEEVPAVQAPVEIRDEGIVKRVKDTVRRIRASVQPVEVPIRISAYAETRAKIVDEIEQLRAAAADAIALDIHADTSEARKNIGALEAQLRLIDKRIEIEVAADTDPVVDGLTAVERRVAGIGKGSQTTSFGQLSFSLAKVGLAAGAALASITPLGTGLVGLAAGAVAVTGAVGLAAGSLVSLGGVAASLGLAFAAVKVGSIGVSDAIKAQTAAQKELAETGEISAATQEKLDTALKGLAPSARNTVKAIGDLGSAWSKVRKATQQELFKGQAANVRALDKSFRPLIGDTLKNVATTLSRASTGVRKFLTTGSGKSQLTTIITGLEKTFTAILPAIGSVGKALLGVFAGASGPATSVAESISRVAERFADFITKTRESGKLGEFFDKANHAAGVLVSVLGNLGGALGGVFAAGAGKGVGVLENLAASLKKFNDVVKSDEGAAALSGFFDTIAVSAKVVTDSLDVIKPVLKGISDILAKVNPALGRFQEALKPIAESLGKSLGEALSNLADPLADVVDGLAGAIEVIGPVVEVLGKLLVLVTELPGPVKTFAIATGLAALAMARLSAAVGGLAASRIGLFFTGLQAQMAAVPAGAARAQAGLVGLARGAGSALKGLAGPAGIGLLITSLSTANEGIATLTGAAGGALIGSTILPGIGTAVGAAVGALGGLYSSIHKANSAAKKEGVEAMAAYAASLDTVTGSATEATGAVVGLELTKNKGKKGKDKSAALADIGVTGREATQAITQGGPAQIALQAKITAGLEKNEAAQKKLNDTIRRGKDPSKTADYTNQLKGLRVTEQNLKALNDYVGGLDKQEEKVRALDRLQADYNKRLEGTGLALKNLPKNVQNIVDKKGIDQTIEGLAKLSTQYGDLNGKQIRTLITASGADVTVKQLKDFIFQARLAGDLPPATVKVNTAGVPESIAAIESVKGPLDALNIFTANPQVDVDPTNALTNTEKADDALDDLDGRTANAAIKVTAGAAKATVDSILRKMGLIRDKTVTVRINQIDQRGPSGLPIYQSADGRITNGPMVSLIGEAGPEAVIPLTRPRRAMELADQSGLTKMILSRIPHLANGAIIGQPGSSGRTTERGRVIGANVNVVVRSPDGSAAAKAGARAGKAFTSGFLKGLDGTEAQVTKRMNALSRKVEKAAKGLGERGRKAIAASLAGKTQLIDLAKQRDALKKTFEDAKTAAESAGTSAKEALIGLGNIGDSFNPVARLKNAIKVTGQYTAAIAALKKAGLNQTSLQQIAAADPAQAIKTARKVLTGGVGKTSQVAQINALQKTLDATASKAGKVTENAVFAAGTAGADGFVKGLKARRAEIEKQMASVARRLGVTLNVLLGNRGKQIKLAQGGVFTKATQAIIGEAGKEVAIPLQQGSAAVRDLIQRSGLIETLSPRDFYAVTAPRIAALDKTATAAQRPNLNSLVAQRIAARQAAAAPAVAPGQVGGVSGGVPGSSVDRSRTVTQENYFNLLATTDPAQQADQIARRLAALMGR